jgi:hypothetical protein
MHIMFFAVCRAVHIRYTSELAAAIGVFPNRVQFALATRRLCQAVVHAALVEAAVLADANITDIASRAVRAVIASLWRLFRSR